MFEEVKSSVEKKRKWCQEIRQGMRDYRGTMQSRAMLSSLEQYEDNNQTLKYITRAL